MIVFELNIKDLAKPIKKTIIKEWVYENHLKLPVSTKNIMYYKNYEDAKNTKLNLLKQYIQDASEKLFKIRTIQYMLENETMTNNIDEVL
jgi:hypothetical protein